MPPTTDQPTAASVAATLIEIEIFMGKSRAKCFCFEIGRCWYRREANRKWIGSRAGVEQATKRLRVENLRDSEWLRFDAAAVVAANVACSGQPT